MQIEKDGLISSKSGNNVLTFSEKSHRYKLNGKSIRSVTGIGKEGYPESHFLTGWKIGQGAEYIFDWCYDNLQMDDAKHVVYPSETLKKQVIKEAKTAWTKKSAEAANIGSIVHDYAYCREAGKSFDYTQIDTHPEPQKINAAIGKFEGWHKKNKDDIIGLEWIVASVNDWYAGKFDRLAKRGKKVVLTDYKTSNGIFIDMFMQLALYRRAIEFWLGIKVDAMEIVRFGKDGAFETKLMDNLEEIQAYEDQALRNLDTCKFKKKYDGDYGF